ncbi:MAG: quinone oxidoreductase family protein [Gemmatimonadales bacterium]
MKAIRIHSTGGPDVLRYEDVPTPSPGPGQVLIRVEAIGVNFIEIYQRTGLYKVAPPFVPGSEAAGTVESLGPGVTGLKVGDHIATVNASGAYAEYALVSAERAVMLPAGVASDTGAAVMLQGITAHYLTHSTFPLAPGHTCLVHAAAGGTGLLMCQIAKRLGACVIGTTSSEDKAALAREAGASEVILYTKTDFAAETMRLTNGAGVQVVYDSVGRTTFLAGLGVIARRGMMVLYGQSSGPVDPVDPQILNQRGSLYLTRPTLGHYIATREELAQRANDVLSWLSDGSLKVRIGAEFPLARAAAAHKALEGRETTGKVLLTP